MEGKEERKVIIMTTIIIVNKGETKVYLLRAVSGTGYLPEDEMSHQVAECLERVPQRLAVPRMMHAIVTPPPLLHPSLYPHLGVSLLETWLIRDGHRDVDALVAVSAV